MTKTLSNNSSLTEAVKLPFMASIFGVYTLFIEKIKPFFIVSGFFALVLMILYFAAGQEALCINGAYRQEHACSNNLINFIVVHLIAFFVLCIFLRIWLQSVLQTKPFVWKDIIPQLADAKVLGLFGVYFLTLVIAGISAYLLIVRAPNPDWKIELGYFTLVSLGFFAPLLTLRFASYIAFAASGEPLPSIKTLWQKTAGNTFIILAGVMILVFFGLFLSQYLLRAFTTTQVNAFYIVLGCEFLSNIVALFITACFTNYCYLQKMFLFERNDNGK